MERILETCKNIGKVIDNITLVLAVCAVACFAGWYFGGEAAEKETNERLVEAFESVGYYGELPEIEINPFTMETNIDIDGYYEDSYNYNSNYYVPEESEYNYNEFSNDSNNDGIPDNMVDSNHDGIPDGFSEVRP